MEAEIKEKELDKTKHEYPKDDLDYAYKFAAELTKEMGKFVKGVVLFGSRARKKTPGHDIDILVILDDISIYLTKEFVQAYRIIVDNLILKISKRLHITTFKFTSFWEFVRNGDPIAINILRDGVPIIDREFFRPLQVLLYQGRIRPSQESMWSYYYKAPQILQESKFKMVSAVMDLYWAVIDASHAALMKINEIPPSPSHVAEMINEKLVKPGLIEKKYANVAQKFYDLSKKIEYREIKEIKGSDYEKYYKEAEEYIFRMRKFIEEKI
ncbi:MAG: nucleotidyltransferase domain-containing protein [Candidatus Aenigmatarchaeota archaeon]